ncbi:MAG TPA: TerC family protein [Egibacteraceae bacterium]|nr:TerC family protein [Egibacteraceae bacterium]
MPDLVLYGGFAVVVAALLAVDLFVVHRESHAVSVKEAATWSGIWIGVAILFGLLVPRLHGDGGTEPMIQYFTGYVIEKSLSVDNVFLFILIFQTFAVPRELQHRVLFYGVLGAIIMRTILIFTGVALIERFEWLLYLFGAFLIYVAVKTWLHREESENIADSNIMKLIRRVLPTTDDYRGQRFLIRENGRLLATPMLVVLILVEFTDLIFAVDSIPAVFAITRDPFIVLTSNVFAILGLRALYFLLAGVAARLHYLKAGLAVILGYVGVKLFTENIDGFPHPSPLQSLGVIVLILAVVIVMSLRRPVEPGEEVPSGVLPFGGEHRAPTTVSDSPPPER